jgi:hypothetical protein
MTGYQAAQGLSASKTAAEVVEALNGAFEGSEFSRIEIWVPEPLGRGLEGLEGVVVEADGRRLSMTFEHVLNPAQEIEVRIPISAEGRPGGRISLYRTTAGPRLFTDLRLVAKLVVPAIHETLERLAGPRTEGEAQVRL